MKIQKERFLGKRILVVGDVMMDSYLSGICRRVSPEAPVPVLLKKESNFRIGGAGNVALNVKAWGCDSDLLSIIGDDSAGETLENELITNEIGCFFIKSKKNPTINKIRVISQNQQLLRIDEEESFSSEEALAILEVFEKIINDYNLVVFSDYAKGTLSYIEEMIDLAIKNNIKIIVDPKGDDFGKYKGATVVTPNESEFEGVTGKIKNEEDFKNNADKLRRKFELKNLLVTRGEKGMALFSEGNQERQWKTNAKEVYDVTGAGDTVVAGLASCIVAGFEIENAAQISNIAAGIAVSEIGTAIVGIDKVANYFERGAGGAKSGTKDIFDIIRKEKKSGRKIVMTNGCFDILHIGHIDYLEKAKKLGDLLVVAINDDQSVKKLKGAERPINCLESRIQMLCALKSVDYVVPFSEDTPINICREILPDILVKGGDYSLEKIVGASEVLENGGEVKVLDYISGFSSTNIIEKIKGFK